MVSHEWPQYLAKAKRLSFADNSMAPTKDGTLDRGGTSSKVAKPKTYIVVLINTSDVPTNFCLLYAVQLSNLPSLYHQQKTLGLLGLKV